MALYYSQKTFYQGGFTMPKRFLTLFISIILILSCSQYSKAEFTTPTSIEEPTSVVVRTDDNSTFRLRWTNPKSVLQLTDDVNDYAYNIIYLIDWKKNDGPWNIGVTYTDTSYNEELHHYQFSGYMASTMSDELGASETFFVSWHLDPINGFDRPFDLKNDTYYFRMRYVLESFDGEFESLYSPYSSVTSIGKNSTNTAITKLDPPKEVKVLVKKTTEGKPYFQLDWSIPDSVIVANKQLPVSHIIDFKIGNGKWLSETISWDWMPSAPSGLLTSTATFNPVEKEYVDEVVIEENIYYFRILYQCIPDGAEQIRSIYSNIASTKVDAYGDAHIWAKPELDKAVENNLIPDSLKGADMTKPITREEFAEVALRLYEVTTGLSASPVSPNPFPDTTNPEILKALNIGIVAGYSDGRFGPKDLINREQVASMLTRAIKKMVPGADFSTIGAPTFKDGKFISSWALNDVMYITKQGIILGSDGKFMPKATTAKEIADGYANTTREMAIMMGVRTFEKFKN
jgi:hypothetical protein